MSQNPGDTANLWCTCDGAGGDAPREGRQSRRQLVGTGMAAALAAWLGTSALTDVAFAGPGAESDRDILVVIFLRGGADGLAIVPPTGDDDYYRLRPNLGIGRKDALPLNDFFALHPALKGIHPFYQEGSLAVLHAVGSGDNSRSHFEAMATMERGWANQHGTEGSGWVARHLVAAPPKSASPLRAVAFDSILPDMLRGAVDVSVLQSLTEFRLQTADDEKGKGFAQTLAALYRPGEDEVARAGRETLAVLDAMKRVDPANYKPQNGADYPKTGLGDALRQVACLMRANVGLEVATLSRGNWDMHVAQGSTIGWVANELKDVGDSLAAFAHDLGPEGMKRVTTVVMTEFGRRAGENDGLGTDHGRASAMLLLGGGIQGGKVYAQWPGLKKEQLEEGLDLRVTTDYRVVLAEIVARRLGGGSWLPQVFPNIGEGQFLGVAQSAARTTPKS